MADIRINALATTATTPASDDYLALDGTAQGTRKILATNIANNVTDVILGSSGPSVKSSLSARAPRQGLVFDGTSQASVSTTAIGTTSGTIALWLTPDSISNGERYLSGTAGVQVYVDGSGKVNLYTAGGTVTTNSSLVVKKSCLIVFSINGTTATPYFNGVVDGSPTTIGSVNNFTAIGGIGSNFASGYIFPLIYNRALSASEVVALYEAGAPAGADYPTQVAGTQLITGTDSDFSGAGNWVANAATVTVSGGKLNVTNCTANNYGTKILKTFQKDVKYRLIVAVSGLTGGTSVAALDSTGTTFATLVAGTNIVEFTAPATGSGYLFIVRKDTDPVTAFSLDDVFMFPLGLLLAPDAAQAGGGLTWYDTSGNAANISWTSGVSWNVPSSQKTASGWTYGGNLTVSSSSAYLKLASTGSSNTWDLFSDSNGSFYLSQSGVVNALRVFPTTGNLSIGAASTDTGEKLQVNGTGYFAGALLQLGNASNDALYRVSASNGKSSDFGDDTTGGFVRANNSQSLRFITAGNIVLTLDSSANATFAGTIAVQGTAARIYSGTGSPEGVVTAATGSIYMNLSGGNNTTFYVKQSGSGNTGWNAK